MTIIEIYQNLQDEKACRDALNINYLSKEDYILLNYLINSIQEEHISLNPGKRILKKQAIKQSLLELKILNQENYQTLLNIIKNNKFIKDFPIHSCGIASSYTTKDNEIITPGHLSNYHIPKKIYEIDVINITHEHCHALKETNYNEHKNSLILGEVIPIFSELIDYQNNPFKEKHLLYRLHWVIEQKKYYEFITSNNNYQTEEEKNMHEFSKSYFGSYLNGFYYAIILYHAYQKEPAKILNLVNDVLSQKTTTLDILNKLNVYCNFEEKIFKQEIKHIKKVLSK